MKPTPAWMMGCEKDGKIIYAIATSYGGIFRNYSQINIYYSKKALKRDYELAKEHIRKIKGKDLVKGCRLFITKLSSSKNPFIKLLLFPQRLAPSNGDGDVKLRAEIKDLRTV